MAPAISIDLKERLVSWYFNDHLPMEEIATTAKVSIGLVSKVINTFEDYGQVTSPFTRRPSEIDQGDLIYLESIMSANPSLYLNEIQDKLATSRHLYVSLSTIARTLQHLDLSRKRISKAAAERDEELHTLWEAQMAEYTDPDVFVFLDESAVDQHTALRTHGRSAIGTRCMRRMAFIRGI
jgi:transposase